MRTVEFSDETIDNIFKDILIEDYKLVCQNVREYRNRIVMQNLEKHEREDFVFDVQIKEAMETLLRYYLYDGDANNLISEQKMLDKNTILE